MRRWLVGAAVAIAAAALSVPGADLYYQSSRGQGCARCHEIAIDYGVWRQSAHRNVNCTECHAATLATNLRRVAAHLGDRVPEQVHLGDGDVEAMLPRCRRCHEQEFAAWSAGAHSTTYARLFTDAEHNRKRLLQDDCLRCHGMHFDGGIGELVTPVSTAGPWRLREASYGARRAIPCLTCHSMHRAGATLARAERRVSAREETMRPSLGWYDRRTRTHVAASMLPMPAVLDGARPVRMSPDQRQALCYQCHAPQAAMQAGSGDDRTPAGVHEGLSCFACHEAHGQGTRRSCATCHPRLSNCGLDVEKMDTTFREAKSGHNVHTVRCADCHARGVPKRRPSR
jgi:hypothetical protein